MVEPFFHSKIATDEKYGFSEETIGLSLPSPVSKRDDIVHWQLFSQPINKKILVIGVSPCQYLAYTPAQKFGFAIVL